MVAWGENWYGECNVPAGLSGVTAIAAGDFHSVVLKGDGTVVAWGLNSLGECNVPAGLSGVTAIAAGYYHTVALKGDGTVVAWGLNFSGQCTVPAGLSGVTAIAGGLYHTVALKGDGTVVAWGDNEYGQCTVPAGLSGVTAIAAGAYHTVALKGDGTVVAWGENWYGECNVPAGLSGVTAIAAGHYNTVALKGDGTVAAWGYNGYGQCNVPPGLSGVTAIAAGLYHTVALKGDGTVIAWGRNDFGQCTVPAGLCGVTAIAVGAYQTVALCGVPSPPGPLITSMVPDQGPIAGGTRVAVNGFHFVPGAKFFFGGERATSVTFLNSTKVYCTVPAHAAGGVDVSLQNPDGQQGLLRCGFTYGSVLTVNATVSPRSLPNEGSQSADLVAVVEAPGGQASVSSVVADLSQLGLSAQVALSDPYRTGTYRYTLRVTDSAIAGDEQITIRVTENTGQVTTALVTVTVTGSAPPPPAINQVTINNLVVKADEFTFDSPSNWKFARAQGHVAMALASRPDEVLLRYDAVLILDKRNPLLPVVLGKGELIVPCSTGDVPLFQGTFSLDAQLLVTTYAFPSEDLLPVCELKQNISSFRLAEGKVITSGPLIMPNSLEEKKTSSADVTVLLTTGVLFQGTVNLPTPIHISDSPYQLFDTQLQLDTIRGSVVGVTKAQVPLLFSVEGTVMIVHGLLDGVYFDVSSSVGIPVPGTPLELDRLAGGLDGLVQPPVELRAGLGLSVGPPAVGLMDLNGDGIFNCSGWVSGHLKVKVLSVQSVFDGFQLGEEEVIWGAPKSQYPGVFASGNVNIMDILVGSGSLKFDYTPSLVGQIDGYLQTPSFVLWLGGRHLTGVQANVNNFDISGKFTQQIVPLLNPVEFSFREGRFSFLVNSVKLWPLFGLSHQGRIAAGANSSDPALYSVVLSPSDTNVSIGAGEERAIFRLTWSEGDTDFNLIRPDGTRITPADAPPDSLNQNYLKNLDQKEAYYVVAYPQAGTWTVEIPDDSGIGEYNIEVWTAKTDTGLPLLQMVGPTDPVSVSSGETVGVSYRAFDSDSDANLRLCWSTSPTGGSGNTIVDDLVEMDGPGTYNWVTTGMSSGTYYVFGVLDDGVNAPVVAYASGPITITNPDAPAQPTGLHGYAGNQMVLAAWNANAEPDLAAYHLYYSVDGGAEQSLRFAAPATLGLIADLPETTTVSLSLTAVDNDGNESFRAGPLTVTLPPPAGNHAPYFTTTPIVSATVGLPYQYDARGTDEDGDPLRYAMAVGPDGMQMAADGTVTWTPGRDQVGDFDVLLVVVDAQGAMGIQGFYVTSSSDGQPILELPPWASPNPARVVDTTYLAVWATDPVPGPAALTYTWTKTAGPGAVTLGAANGTATGDVLDAVFAQPGAYTFQVAVSDGDTTKADNVTLNVLPLPTLTTVTPSMGSRSGGQAVTVAGTDFYTSGTVTVSFGGEGATAVLVGTATAITCRTPAHLCGVVAVELTSPGGHTFSINASYTYFDDYEADTAPRDSGGDGAPTIADWVQVGRFAARLDTVTAGLEFQKADCAPKETSGDGDLGIADWVQAGRYAAALDDLQTMDGPTEPGP